MQLAMSALEFMQRRVGLVLTPRLYQIRFHNMLVPDARLRVQTNEE